MGYGWPSLERERIPIGYLMLMNYWKLMDVSERGRKREREREVEREREGGEIKMLSHLLRYARIHDSAWQTGQPKISSIHPQGLCQCTARLYNIIALLQHFLIIISI